MVVPLPPSPLIYEINTWPWLTELTSITGTPIDLGSVPAAEWDRIAASGFDAVWLMGVWRRSPRGIEIAKADAPLMGWFAESLPGFTDDDVVGSPYAVREYIVDDHLGGPDALATARAELARRGVGLILDYVPNHVAVDHPWTADPSLFITGTPQNLAEHPESYVEVNGAILANGRDPYFPAWRDVVQVNPFSPAFRAAAVSTLLTIAEQCDGVRCDMAMLVMNDVFVRTWGDAGGATPDDKFWPATIEKVRAHHPGFRFIAEAYWGTEPELIAQGFDHCYDKVLYDTLRTEPPRLWSVLSDDVDLSRNRLRFIENHDEERAAPAFGTRDRQCAVTVLSLPGARMVHQGQIEGRRRRLPVQLGRFADEPVDADRVVFYRALLAVVGDAAFGGAEWFLCGTRGAAGGGSPDAVVAWTRGPGQDWLVVVNTGAGDVVVDVDLPGTPASYVSPVTGERPPVDAAGAVRVAMLGWGWQIYRRSAGAGCEAVSG